MSVVIETLVICDGCSENYGGDDRYSSAKTIRAKRKKYGWIQRGAEDYCEECAKMRKANRDNARAKADQKEV